MKEILKKDLLRIINEENENDDFYDDSEVNDPRLSSYKPTRNAPATNWKDSDEITKADSGNDLKKRVNVTGRKIETNTPIYKGGTYVGRTIYDRVEEREVPVIYVDPADGPTVDEWINKYPEVFEELKEKYGMDLTWTSGSLPKFHPRKKAIVLNPIFHGGKGAVINTETKFETPASESKMNKLNLYSIVRDAIAERSPMVKVYKDLMLPEINVKREFLNRHEGKMTNFNLHLQSHGYLVFGTPTEDMDADGNMIPLDPDVQNIPEGVSQYLDTLVKKMSGIDVENLKTIHTARQHNKIYNNWGIDQTSMENIRRKFNEKTQKGFTPYYGLNYLGRVPDNVTMSIFDRLTIVGRIKNNNTGDLCYGTNSDINLNNVQKSEDQIKEEIVKVYTDLENGSNDYYLELRSEFIVKYGQKLKEDPRIGQYLNDKSFNRTEKVPLNKDTFAIGKFRRENDIIERPRLITEVPEVRFALIAMLEDLSNDIKSIDLSDMLMKVSVPIEGGNELYEHQINQIIKNVIKEIMYK